MSDSIDIVDTDVVIPVVIPNTRVLANGAIYDMNKGRIVANPGGGNHAITSESASAMHLAYSGKRIQAQLAAQTGLARIVPGKPSALRAWSNIAEAQAKEALKGGRTSVESARFVGQATGFLADQRRNAPESARNNVQVNVYGSDLARSLLSELSGIRDMLVDDDS